MPARLRSDDGRNVVIRPLVYVPEPLLARFAEEQRFPILPCNLCGSQSQAQRKQIKAMLARLEGEHPGLKQTMLAALGNVNPSHLLDASLLGGVLPGGADPTLDAARVVEQEKTSRRRLPIVEKPHPQPLSADGEGTSAG
jgi:tRNA 2-thiocytidine biosynthesis protein TtcA